MRSLRIAGFDFSLLGELAGYTSLQITRRHFGTGDFELHVPAGLPYAAQLALDRLLIPADEPQKAMLIESLVTEEAKDEIVAKGCTLDGIARGRLVVPPPSADDSYGWDRITADAESVFQHYAAMNLVSPSDPKRAVPGMALAPNQHRGMPGVAWQGRFEALDALLKELGEYTDLGWAITPDLRERTLIFDVAPGRDLRAGNPGGSHVIFSLGMGNAADVKRTLDRSSLRNTAYVGGQGEDEQRLILAVGEEFEGLARRETWVDGGSVELPGELVTLGRRKLAQSAAKDTLQASVIQHGAFLYGRDWDLGDLVTLQALAGRMDARVIEVRETYERDKPLQLAATFGDAPATLTGTLREMQNTTVR